ncbi:leucine-rich repeat domain-containing protein [Xanthocytophaga flava]|uniref:leucine-rich repeat domain-containing protein n=1 Tax=Xanthocytophaga flava TaxID=3048013 RepID=UPI0028D444F8|nr:hypothetical protein [Xanthocytophaga flavus]MDJ1469692.1 hypothetical protein [Xanthocytophaga flavus]
MEELEVITDSLKANWASYTEVKKLIVKGAKEKFPSEIVQLKNLEYLSIEGVPIITNSIFELNTLKELHVKGKLTDNKFSKSYPDHFDKLTAVTRLSLGSAPAPFPASVWRMPALKTLTLTIEDCRSLPPGNFSSLSQLEELHLISNHFSDEVLTEIASLSNLRSITLDVINVNNYPLKADLSALGRVVNLEEIVIRNAQLDTLPVSFKELANLKSFRLEATNLRRFETSLVPYFVNLPENLESLYLDYIGFDVVPDSIGRLKKLKSLYLTSKCITKGYENLLLLSNCEQIYFRFYRGDSIDPLGEKIEYSKDKKTKYSELRDYVEGKGMDIEIQKQFMRFVYKDLETFLDKETLLHLLDYPNKRIREEAFVQLAPLIRNPFSDGFAKDKAVISLTGKIKQRKTQELSGVLKEKGYMFSPVLDNSVTHLIISPTERTDTSLLYSSTVQLALPEHLMELLEKEATPFLKAGDVILEDSLMALLFSEDESNTLLALEMMLEGGIPENRFTEFAICFLMKRYQQKETKEAFRKVIEKHCSTIWQHFLRSNARKSILEDSNHKIIRHEVIKLDVFLRKGLEIGFATSKAWFVYFFDRILDFQPDLAELPVRCLITDHTLDLIQVDRWRESSPLNLGKSLSRGLINIANLTQIERVIITGRDFADLSTSNYSFFANLKKMPNLQEIIISGTSDLSWVQDRLAKTIEKARRELPSVVITQEKNPYL